MTRYLFRRLLRRRLLPLLVVAAAAPSGCSALDDLTATTSTSPGAALQGARDAPPPGSRPDRIDPIRDKRGLHPGLTPVPAASRSTAVKVIELVTTSAERHPGGYDRDEQFGEAWTDDVDITWGRDGCRTREQILHRDLKAIEFRSGTNECVVLEGTLNPEPYTGRLIEFSKSRPEDVQVDHVLPLSFAYKQGADGWSQSKRLQLANDPLNLLAVDGQANQDKSDSGPADWTPANAAVRCAYAVRFARVARKYKLPVRPADKRTMLKLCR